MPNKCFFCFDEEAHSYPLTDIKDTPYFGYANPKNREDTVSSPYSVCDICFEKIKFINAHLNRVLNGGSE